MNDSSCAAFGVAQATKSVGVAIVVGLVVFLGAGSMFADGPELRLRARAVGAGASAGALTIELFRWSTDTERAPLMTALVSPPAPPATSVTPPGGRAGRGGRGGRGAAPPPSPLARLTAAIKAAPTVGFIWGEGVTGYSIKYAWRSSSTDGAERIVLVTDRRVGAHGPGQYPQSAAATDAEFTLIELQIGGTGKGEGKTSLTSAVVIDTAAQTLALEGYAEAPALFEVTR